MVKSSNSKSYILKTNVKVGKSYKSGGWALNREDIAPLIPVTHYECSGYIEIEGIKSECKLRCNPRLFYKSHDLSIHLENLFYEDSNKKVPMEILLNEEDLYNNFISNYSNLESLVILTLLPVGKSYSSKGWRLPKDVISKLIPLNEFYDTYSIFVDGIPSEAKLDIQLRLFYKSNELSEFLENIYNVDPKRRIFAKISLNDFVGNNINEMDLPSLEEISNICIEEGFDSKIKNNSDLISSKKYVEDSKLNKSFKQINESKSINEFSSRVSNFSTVSQDKSMSNMDYSINEKIIYGSRGEPLSSLNPKYKREVNSKDYGSVWYKESELNVPSVSNVKRCDLCNKLIFDKLFLEEAEYLRNKFPNLCSFCIEKIFVLEMYYNLKTKVSSGYFTRESLLTYLGPESNKNKLHLLDKFGLIVSVSEDIFKLSLNEDLEKDYSKFVENAQNSIIHKHHRGFNSKLILDDYDDYDDY